MPKIRYRARNMVGHTNFSVVKFIGERNVCNYSFFIVILVNVTTAPDNNLINDIKGFEVRIHVI